MPLFWWSVAKKRLNQNQMIAGLIIHLSPSYFRCLRGKYLDFVWSKGVFACQCCCCCTIWPDQMGMEIASLLIFFGAVWKQTHLHSTAEDSLPVNVVQKKKEKKKTPLSFIWLFSMLVVLLWITVQDKSHKGNSVWAAGLKITRNSFGLKILCAKIC